MALQLSLAVRNARLDVTETTIGLAPLLQFFTGTQPANCAEADSGTKLAEMTLPSDWLAAASAGSKAKIGTWADTSANATGTLGHWRLKDSTDTTCHMQGKVTPVGGSGEITVNNVSVTAGEPFSINTFTLTDPNA